MSAPFQCWREPDGNLWVSAGRVISINSGSTVSYSTSGTGFPGVAVPEQSGPASAVPTAPGRKLIGGSGRNYLVSGGPVDPDFPIGCFRPIEPDIWDSPEFGEASINRDSGTGVVSLHDGTDVVGETAGPLGGLSGTPSAGTYPITDWAEDGYYAGVGAYYQAVGYPLWTLFHDFVTGDAGIRFSGADQLSRPGGSTTDPSGTYVAGAQAEIDFNGGSAWNYAVTVSSLSGTMTASSYGETTYNGGSPFTFGISYEGDITGRGAVVNVDTGTAQEGLFSWTGWQEWTSDDDDAWKVTIDSFGEGSLHDGTNVVATRAADASKLYDPTGRYDSTAYGDTTYGGSANVVSGSPSAGTLEAQDFAEAGTVGSIETWNGATEPGQYVELDTVSGDAHLFDGAGIVASRLGGSTANINGSYASTDHGAATYNGTAAFTFTIATTAVATGFSVSVGSQVKRTMEGWVYVVLTVNGSNEVTAVDDPQFAATMPANTSTAKSIPLAYSDGAGIVEQIQTGPILWRA